MRGSWYHPASVVVYPQPLIPITAGTGPAYTYSRTSVDCSEGNFGLFVRRRLTVADRHSLDVVITVLASSLQYSVLFIIAKNVVVRVLVAGEALTLGLEEDDGCCHGSI